MLNTFYWRNMRTRRLLASLLKRVFRNRRNYYWSRLQQFRRTQWRDRLNACSPHLLQLFSSRCSSSQHRFDNGRRHQCCFDRATDEASSIPQSGQAADQLWCCSDLAAWTHVGFQDRSHDQPAVPSMGALDRDRLFLELRLLLEPR